MHKDDRDWFRIRASNNNNRNVLLLNCYRLKKESKLVSIYFLKKQLSKNVKFLYALVLKRWN